MDLLLLKNDDNSHYVSIKDFDRFMFHKTKDKSKKKNKLQKFFTVFQQGKCEVKHKQNCLSINGKQSVKIEKGIIEIKNHFKQIPVPFKIYADFECNLRGVEGQEGSCTKKYQDHVPSSFAYKIVCIDDRFSKRIVVYRVKMLLMNLLKPCLRSINIAKK